MCPATGLFTRHNRTGAEMTRDWFYIQGDQSLLERRLLKFSSYLISVLWHSEEEGIAEIPYTLTATTLIKLGNYDLALEDPSMYTNIDPTVPREWPQIPLPSITAAQLQPEPAKIEESEKIQKLLAVHHTYVDILKSLGVDPIKHYQENQVEALL